MKNNMNKIKEQYVLVTIYDKNRKPHFVVCEDIETAKKYYPSNNKQFITFVTKD